MQRALTVASAEPHLGMIVSAEARAVATPTGNAILATARPDPARYDVRPGAELRGTWHTLNSDGALLDLIDRLRREAGSPQLQPREADELAQLRRAVTAGIADRRRAVLTDRNHGSEPPSEWLSVKAVADRLAVSTRFVRTLLTAGRLRGQQNGPRGTWRIDPLAVELYESERKP